MFQHIRPNIVIYIQMRYLLAVLVLVVVKTEIELTHFTPNTAATAIHQLPNTHILIGTATGAILTYSPKGQLLNELRGTHSAPITSISSYTQAASTIILVADKEGLLTAWEEAHLMHKIEKEQQIMEITISNQGSNSILALQMANSLSFYSLPSLKLIRTIGEDAKIFKKVVLGPFPYAYFAVQKQKRTYFYSYDIQQDTMQMLLQWQYPITDISFVKLESSHLFLINEKRELEIFQLDQDNKVIGHLSSRERQLMPSPYSSLTFFPNQHGLPLFAAVRDAHQVEFFNGFQVTLFLQLNPEIVAVHSSVSDRLMMLSASGQVTALVMRQGKDDLGVWLLVVMVCLLGGALYLCCGDCCPGVIAKWRLQRERQEIELELYRQRTELDNF